MESKNFADWAAEFVFSVKVKNKNRRKVLLTYNGYRSHISLRALKILKEAGVMAYCLPAHTSGNTQPLYVGLYGPFKNYLNTEVYDAQQSRSEGEFDQFDLLHMICRAYEKAFTVPKVVRSF